MWQLGAVGGPCNMRSSDSIQTEWFVPEIGRIKRQPHFIQQHTHRYIPIETAQMEIRIDSHISRDSGFRNENKSGWWSSGILNKMDIPKERKGFVKSTTSARRKFAVKGATTLNFAAYKLCTHFIHIGFTPDNFTYHSIPCSVSINIVSILIVFDYMYGVCESEIVWELIQLKDRLLVCLFEQSKPTRSMQKPSNWEFWSSSKWFFFNITYGRSLKEREVNDYPSILP